MDKLSVIVPCYNEEKSVMLFYIELCKVICRMNHTEFEILFVDDGSSDKTREIIERIATQDARVFFLSFSRNFCRVQTCQRQLRRGYGRGFAGPAFTFAGNVSNSSNRAV